MLGGWVDAKKAVGYVDWGLLLLIGSALGLSKGIVNSGLAGYVGSAIRDSGMSAEASLFVVYAFTMVTWVSYNFVHVFRGLSAHGWKFLGVFTMILEIIFEIHNMEVNYPYSKLQFFEFEFRPLLCIASVC